MRINSIKNIIYSPKVCRDDHVVDNLACRLISKKVGGDQRCCGVNYRARILIAERCSVLEMRKCVVSRLGLSYNVDALARWLRPTQNNPFEAPGLFRRFFLFQNAIFHWLSY